jgi:hypothetical protein
MKNINKLLVNHIKSLYNTACIISKQKNTGFVPLPVYKIDNRQKLFSYGSILNHFIRDPNLSFLNNDYRKKKIKNKTYIEFPDEIIKLKYKNT